MKAKRIEFVDRYQFPERRGENGGQVSTNALQQRLENVEFEPVQGPGIAVLFEDEGQIQQHVIPMHNIRRIVLEGDAIGAFDVQDKRPQPMSLEEGKAKLEAANAEFDRKANDAARGLGTGAAGGRAQKSDSSRSVHSE